MQVNRNIEDLAEPFKTHVKAWMKECSGKGLNIKASETLRTKERQAKLVQEGKSWTMDSKHLIGEAVDIYFDSPSGDIYLANDPKGIVKWQEVARIAREYGIEWGYDMWGIDKPHFQMMKTLNKKIDTKKEEIQNKSNLKTKTMKITGYIFVPKDIEAQINYILNVADEIGVAYRLVNPNPAKRSTEIGSIVGAILKKEENEKIRDAWSDVKEHFEMQDQYFTDNLVYKTYPRNDN